MRCPGRSPRRSPPISRPNHLETATNFAETEAFDIFADVTFRVSEQFEIGVGARYSHDEQDARAISSAVLNGRSILGGFIGALGQPEPIRTGLLTALAAPGAATIPPSAMYPVPLFGLGFQPTTNNGDTIAQDLDDGGFTWRLTARYAPTPRQLDLRQLCARPPARGACRRAAGDAVRRGPLQPASTPRRSTASRSARAPDAGRTLFLDARALLLSLRQFPDDRAAGHAVRHHQCRRGDGLWLRGADALAGAAATPPSSPPTPGTTAASTPACATATASACRPITASRSAASSASTSGRAGSASCRASPISRASIFDDDNDRPALQQPPNALVADNLQDEVQDGYVLVNARLGYTFSERFTIEAFVTNLFDEDYIKDAGNTGDAVGLPTFIAGEPRLYGVQASVRF